MRIACIVGARPNFMKIAPILRAMEGSTSLTPTLIHTGQHYDKNLSEVFFDELGIPRPDIDLNIGSGTHAQQTANVMVAIEKVLMDAEREGNPFGRMVVVGDVNSTAAAAIAAVKLHVPVAHVEAGLRSFDRTMPEEINRMLTDSICETLLVSEPAGVENLKREGHPSERIHLVGNVMIDTLLTHLELARDKNTLSEFGLNPKEYGVITLHRPANVDDPDVLNRIVDVLIDISDRMQFVFPVHPRTLKQLQVFGLEAKLAKAKNIQCIGPAGYLDFLCLTSQAQVIVTDSGGLQEESTALQVPCLTLRPNTERPITTSVGTSALIDSQQLQRSLESVIEGTYKQGACPELWDGNAATRIVKIMESLVADNAGKNAF